MKDIANKDVCKIKNSQYMKMSNELKESVSVVNFNFYIENGEFTLELSDDTKKLLDKYSKMQYYWMYEYEEN